MEKIWWNHAAPRAPLRENLYPVNKKKYIYLKAK